jgi:hypothetical protein
MRPNFALSLLPEGISLLFRAPDGWRRVGDAQLDTPNLPGALAKLRAEGQALTTETITTKIVIPNDQVRYLSVDTKDCDGAETFARVQEALETATPYRLDDLAYDVHDDDEVSYVAAVALETLEEAEAFANEHAFNPLGFVAIPDAGDFPGEPSFGNAARSDDFVSDAEAIVVVGDADPDPALTAVATPLPFASRRAEADRVSRLVEIEHGNGGAEAIGPSLGGPSMPGAEPDFSAVSAPGLEIPDLDDTPADDPVVRPAAFVAPPKPDGADPAPAAPPARLNFGGRARPAKPKAPVATRVTAPAPVPAANIVPAPVAHAPAPEDETARMTIFGARDNQADVGGKPRFLGLILTAALLLFMALVGLWATFFLDDGVNRLWVREPSPAAPEVSGIAPDALPRETDLTTPQQDEIARPSRQANDGRPAASVAEATAPSEPDTAPIETAPVLSAEPPTLQENIAAQTPAEPVLSSTDAAVLDALSEDNFQSPLAAQPLPAPERIAALPEADTSTEAEPPATPTPLALRDDQTTPPTLPEMPALISLDDLFVAAIDRTEHAKDAVALLPQESFQTDRPVLTIASPPPAEATFELDTTGLVVPTPNGTLNPDGVLIYLGPPPVVPPETPNRSQPEPEVDTQRALLAGLRPRPRPGDLAEQTERNQLGGLTRDELVTLRPRLRPRSLSEEIAQREADERAAREREAEAQTTETETTDTDTGAETADGPVSALARATVLRPTSRPRNFERIVRRQQPQNRETREATVRPQTVTPRIPSSASVARQATLNNAINLRRVNLIGVYGSPSNRRALVRLPSGRYKKVKVGDRVDGGRILAIGDNELRYQKGGRNVTLKIPSG